MVLGRRWVLKQHFVGAPKHEDFELVEEELPALKENEIMFRRVCRKNIFIGNMNKFALLWGEAQWVATNFSVSSRQGFKL